jgi:hypothetical protein
VELAAHQLRAGDVRGWAGSLEAALELALAHRDWDAGGRALSSMLDGGTPWSWLSYGAVRTRPVELLTDLVALAPAEPAAGAWVKCLATAVLAAELYFTRDTGRCRRLSHDALELARRIDDSALFATVVALSEMAVWASNGAAERIALRREALERGLTTEQEAAALYRNAVDLQQIVQVTSADEALRRCAQLVSGHRSSGWDVAIGHLRASRLVAAGNLAAGEHLAVETYRAHRRTTMGAADTIIVGLMLSIRLEQGRLVEAQPALEQALADSDLPILHDALAFLFAHTKRYEDAEAILAAGEATRELPDDGLLTGRLAFRAFTCYDLSRAGRPIMAEAARALRDGLAPSAGQVVMHGGGIGVWGAVDLFLGMATLLTGDVDAASDTLQRAVAVNDRAGNPAWGARSRRLLSRTIAGGGGRSGGSPATESTGSLIKAADAAVATAGMPLTAGRL